MFFFNKQCRGADRRSRVLSVAQFIGLMIVCCWSEFSLAANIDNAFNPSSDGMIKVYQALDAGDINTQALRAVPNKPHALLHIKNEYRLSAGDKIKIHVLDEKDMDIEVRLGKSGDIRYPFLGKLHISGMTLPALEQKIRSGLSDGFLINPQVRISIEEFRPFYINGEIKKPGGYPYQPGLTVRKAISLAGGFTKGADKGKVFLIYAGDRSRFEHKVYLRNMMNPGDIVTVKQSFFYLNGEVKSPGRFPYRAGTTIRMAISMAGGFTARADKDYVIVIHKGDSRPIQMKNLNATVNYGDILTVEDSFF